MSDRSNSRDWLLASFMFVGTVTGAFGLIHVTNPSSVSASDEVFCDTWTRVEAPTPEHKKKMREPDLRPVCYGVGNQCRDRMVFDPASGEKIVHCEIVE